MVAQSNPSENPQKRRKAGRPSVYSEAIATEVLRRLAEGETLLAICQEPNMPARTSWYEWIDLNEDLRARCARARERQADAMDDLIMETANACDETNSMAARVKISAYQWRAMKLAPKKYGEKVVTPIDDNGEPTPVTLMFFGGRQLNGAPRIEDGSIDVDAAERHSG